MRKKLRITAIVSVILFLAVGAYADTFDTLFFTAPNGWTKQEAVDKTTYQRKSGIGAIVFYASYPTTGSASDEFARMWKLRLEPILSVKAPQHQVERESDLIAAIGMQAVNAQGTTTIASLTVFVGRGKAIGVVSLSAGEDVLREITTFFESIKVLPEKRDAISGDPRPSSGSASTGTIEFDYHVPPGLTAKNDGQMIMLAPPKLGKDVCAYWVSPPRPSKGSLEADARAAALGMPIPGGQILDPDRYNALRGTVPDGWKYFLFGTEVRNSAHTTIAYVMALAFPAGAGQVNIVLGLGDGASTCEKFDLNFVRLFHSLSPRGWRLNDGNAFSKELTGLWRSTNGGPFFNSNNFFLSQYNFMANGRYDSGRGSITTTGNLETTTAAVSDGNYRLNGNTLTIIPNSRNASKFRVRVFEDHLRGGWWRKMALFNEETKIEREYERIGN